jgi:hypothetical protein
MTPKFFVVEIILNLSTFICITVYDQNSRKKKCQIFKMKMGNGSIYLATDKADKC